MKVKIINTLKHKLQWLALMAAMLTISQGVWGVTLHVSSESDGCFAIYIWASMSESWPGPTYTPGLYTVQKREGVTANGNAIINNCNNGKQSGDIAFGDVDRWILYNGTDWAGELMNANNCSTTAVGFASDGLSGWTSPVSATWDGTNRVFKITNQSFSNGSGINIYIGNPAVKFAYFDGNSHSAGTYDIVWNPFTETVTFTSAAPSCTDPTDVTATVSSSTVDLCDASVTLGVTETGGDGTQEYSWSVSPSAGVTITNGNTNAPSATFTTPGTYTFTVQVGCDISESYVEDDVTVTVNDYTYNVSNNNWCGGNWATSGCSMTYSDSKYSKLVENLAAGTYEFKITRCNNWDWEKGYSSGTATKSAGHITNTTNINSASEGANISFTTTEELNVTVYYDGTDAYIYTAKPACNTVCDNTIPDFGTVAVNSSKTETFVFDYGATGIASNTVSLIDNNSGFFSLGTVEVDGTEMTVTVPVTYRPTSAGTHTAKIRVAYTGGQYDKTISATATAATVIRVDVSDAEWSTPPHIYYWGADSGNPGSFPGYNMTLVGGSWYEYSFNTNTLSGIVFSSSDCSDNCGNKQSKDIKDSYPQNPPYTLGTNNCYIVNAATDGGDSNKRTVTKVVCPSEFTDVEVNDASVCVGSTVTLTKSSDPNTDVTWTFSSSDTDKATVDSYGVVTGKAVGTTTITATASKSGYISKSATCTVTVNTPPTTQTVSGTATICTGSTTSVTLSSTQSGYTYELYKDGSTTSQTLAGNGSSQYFTVSAAGTYTVKAYDSTSGGCVTDMSGSAVITVVAGVPSAPGAVAGGYVTTEDALCSGNTITLNAPTGFTNSPTHYKWYINGVTDDTWYEGSTYSYTIPNTSDFTAYVFAKNVCGSSAGASPQTTFTGIGVGPSISSQPADQSICKDATPTALSVTASGSDISYQWYSYTSSAGAGEAIINNQTNSTYTPSASTVGTYYYACKVTACSTTIRSNIATFTVKARPSISSTSSGSNCGPGTVTLGATASAGTVNWYAVQTGGSIIENGVSYTTASLNETTSYWVDATNNGCTTASRTEVVATIKIVPTITETTPGSRCGTGTVTLQASASTGNINWYAASTGGSSLHTGTAYTTPSISASTSYWVDATYSGCTTPTRTEVVATVNSYPDKPAISSYDEAVCSGGAPRFTFSSTSGITYQMYVGESASGSSVAGDGGSKTLTAGTISSATTFNLKATNASGCSTSSDDAEVSITPDMALTSIALTPDNICVGNVAVASETGLNLGGSGSIAYTASPSDKVTIDGHNITGAAVANGITITGTVSGGCGSNVSRTATLNVKAAPTAYTLSVIGSTTICSAGGTLSLSDSDTGYSYQLLKDGNNCGTAVAGTGSAINFSVNESGHYTCKAYLTDSPSCYTMMNISGGGESIELHISLTPQLMPATPTVTSYTPVVITSINTDIESWTITRGGSAVADRTAYLYNQTSNTVTVKAAKAASSYTITATTRGGCSQTATLTVTDDTEDCD